MWRTSTIAWPGLLLVVALGSPSAAADPPVQPVAGPSTARAAAPRPAAAPNAADYAIHAAVRPPSLALPDLASTEDPVRLKPITRDTWTEDRDPKRHAFEGQADRYGLPPASLPLAMKLPF